MSIGITDEHRDLAGALRTWAQGLTPLDQVRAAEGDLEAQFADAWKAVGEMAVTGIGLPESLGGGGGTLLDSAVALEACAHELVPGPLLSTAVAAALLAEEPDAARLVAAGEASVGVGPRPTLQARDTVLTGKVDVVWDAPSVTHLLLGDDEGRWYLVPADRTTTSSTGGFDLTRRVGAVELVDVPLADVREVPGMDADRLRRTAVTLAAAEASGVARWCLETAVGYAGVREQFGVPIGSFQAIKHLCAEMLERAEAVTAVAWDAATSADGDVEQWEMAVDVAGAVAFDEAVRVAQDCIQVLGGIGFTFEHDAHFRLRRATSLRSLVGSLAGGTDGFAANLAARAATGVRRRVRVDFHGEDATVRTAVRDEVAAVAGAPVTEHRVRLADAGLLAPHWPAPWGRGAGPLEQLVIDEELGAAGIERPDLKIGAWAAPTIVAHGNEAQQERFVAPTLRGEITWCQLFSEPGAGSDLAALRTRAERVDGGWRLTGQKVWTSLAHEADWAICLARTDPDAPRHRGISYFLLDMTAEGIETRPLREMTGDALFNEVFLDAVFVPDECVVGEVNEGWRIARSTLANERVAMAGTRLGTSVELAVELLAEGGLGPAADVRVGRAVALSTVCALLGVRSTLRSLAGQGPGAESSVAKLLTVRNRQDASELVVDLFGDRVVAGDPRATDAVHEMLLTRCLSIAGGTTQVLRNVAAERILGLPR